MSTSPARIPEADVSETAARRVGRPFFASAAAVALAGAATLAFAPLGPSHAVHLVVGSGVAGYGLLCALGARLAAAPRFPITAALCAATLIALALIGAADQLLGEGLNGAALGLGAVIVCVVGAVTGVRVALLLGAAAIGQLLLLAWAQTSGSPGAVAALALPPAALLGQLLVVVCASVGGALIARVLRGSLQAAAERERRFRSLLQIAANWYWEQDDQFRFTYLSELTPDNAGKARSAQLNQTPWQIADMGLTEAQLDAHRADLEAHRPFSGLLARRRDARGAWRTISISGEPTFTGGQVFTGYWGVARDVTVEVRAQRAGVAGETRYRELFARSPSPLFLHRRGIVFDANAAAARLFGFADAAAMQGFDIVGLFPPGAARDRIIDRVAQLEGMPIGSDLPVEDYLLRALDGRPLSVQGTAVRVDSMNGAATLSIYFDITVRKAVERALRRSEAMLSHLFATSPDCIALAEIETGRFAMVNPAFCRVTGYASDAVVGRTATELGIWHDRRDAAELFGRIERDGRVAEMSLQIVTKAGTPVPMLLAAGRFEMDGRDYLVVNARDVTDSERTRLQHTAILERASIGIAFTRDRRFVQANPFFERMFGWPAGGLVGQPGAAVWASDAAYDAIGELAAPLLSAGEPFEAERRMHRRDGSEFWCRLLAQVVNRDDPIGGGTIWIAEDVSERRRLDAALAAARDAAEAASRAKTAFLANTSHEIRTPLNGLLGLARLAMQPGIADARRRQYLAQVVDSAESLAGVMTDILDVSKIEAGKITLEDVAFELHDTLETVARAYRSLADVKGLALRLGLDAALPRTVRGDPFRVRQILSNFITNAIKFTVRGEVCIEASPTADGGVRLAVTDTGAGLDEATIARLFMRFSQGDSSTTRRFGGTGLGLSICRELAQLMGGRVGVESRPGSGSTFWTELPLPACAPAALPTDTEADDRACLLGARVLMVEDNPVNMMIAVAMLEAWGVRTAQAFDGRVAVAAVQHAAQSGDPFDAVLMDVQMPTMSGHEAARELRLAHAASSLPIIALTAAALVSERDEALAAGMDDFLTKPIDAARLRATLARHVARSARPRA